MRMSFVATLTLLFLSPAAVDSAPVLFPGNGHFYELISVQTSWSGARTSAATYSHLSVIGHLATVTSAAEDSFLSVTFATGQPAAFAWLAGYEPNDNGVWLWGAGPEQSTQFAQGAVSTPPYNYVNWGGIEPNDFAPGEDFLAINLGATFAGVAPGRWIDSPNPNPSDPIFGFVVEYDIPITDVQPSRTPMIAQTIFPNPLAGSGMVSVLLSRPAELTVEVFDVVGRVAQVLVWERTLGSGDHAFSIDTSRLVSGIYFVRTAGRWSDGTREHFETVDKLTVTR